MACNGDIGGIFRQGIEYGPWIGYDGITMEVR